MRSARRDITQSSGEGLVVKPDVALRQQQSDQAAASAASTKSVVIGVAEGSGRIDPSDSDWTGPGGARPNIRPNRYHGTVKLDATRVGRDAGRIADEVIAHPSGIVGANVSVTLEIEATVPDGVADHVVRTVTENSRTLKFTSHGFETD